MIFPFAFFALGFYCILSKHNLIKLFIGISCLFKASDLLFVITAGADPIGGFFMMICVALEACFAAILIVYIAELHEHFGIKDMRDLMRLKQ